MLGHLFFENSIINFTSIKWQYKLLPRMNSQELEDFLTPYQLTLSPEVALSRTAQNDTHKWRTVSRLGDSPAQFIPNCTPADGSRIKIIISNYMVSIR